MTQFEALKKVAEATRAWLNVAASLPYQDQKELDAMSACEKALNDYYAIPTEAPGEMVASKIVQFSEGDDWLTVLLSDGSMFRMTDGGTRWKPLPSVPEIVATVEDAP